MATSIPTNHFVDQRTVLAQDLARNRQITINLQKKFAPISDALCSEHQASLYPTILQVRNPPSLANLLANELESTNQTDPLQLEGLGMTNLLTITDQDTADYIMDRLDDEDIDNMNQHWVAILKTIKTKYTKINKDKFIDIVKSYQEHIPEHDITERGQRRQNSAADLKAQQQSDYEEVRDTPNREAELRGMREHDRFAAPQEGGVANAVERDRLNFGDIHASSGNTVTPRKNPMRPETPKKEKGYYADVYKGGIPKPTNDDEAEKLSEVKNEIKYLKVRDLKTYIKNITGKPVPAAYDRTDLIKIATVLGYEKTVSIRTGSGLRRRRIIRGRGSPERVDSDSEDEEEKMDKKKMLLNNDKFGISLEKLRRNVLHVYYVSSRASIPALKRENITNDVKDVLLDILSDKFSVNLFNKLQPDEKRLISTFVRVMKIKNIDMKGFDDAYQARYEVLLGEVNSGQDNPKIKQELKLYILRGIAESLIPKHQGQLMLYDLSL